MKLRKIKDPPKVYLNNMEVPLIFIFFERRSPSNFKITTHFNCLTVSFLWYVFRPLYQWWWWWIEVIPIGFWISLNSGGMGYEKGLKTVWLIYSKKAFKNDSKHKAKFLKYMLHKWS